MQSLLDSVPGAVSVALVDSTSGMSLAHTIQPSYGLSPEGLSIAAAGNANVIRAMVNTIRDMGVAHEIDDIMMTLDDQYHLVKVLKDENLFIFLAVSREGSNLSLARFRVNRASANINL